MNSRSLLIKTILFNRIYLLFLIFGFTTANAQTFSHPGLLNNAADLNRAKAGVSAATEPWRSAWERLQNSQYPGVSGSYTPSPVATVTDTGSRSETILHDGEAAYVNAIEWWITGNQTYANTAITILNAWASTCTLINGSNAELAANIDFFDLVNAAEIIRYSDAGWSSANITAFSNFLTNVIYPVISSSSYDSWGSGSNVMLMMIGIFSNDTSVYNQGYDNFISTNAAVACWTCLYDTNSISVGQSVDSWRDQGHAQLGVSIGVEAAEIALNATGQNLFTLDSDLLLSAVEYTGKYNLGHTITWDNTFGTTPTHISNASRGRFWPFYAMAQSGFTRSGLSGTYTNQVVAAEGIESLIDQGGGLGTLLYTQASTARPVPQYALLAFGTPSGYLMAGDDGADPVTASSPAIRTLETFQEIIQGNGYSGLKSEANQLILTTTGASSLIANSTQVWGDEQEFKVVDLGNMQYQFVSDVNAETLQVNSDGTITPGSGSNNAFNVYSVGSTIPAVITNLNGNTYQVTNQNSGYAIDVSGASKSNGAVVDQWAYDSGTNQQWTFTNIGNGFYTLANVNSGLLLDVENASTSEGALIDQYSSTGDLNQQWVIQYADYADTSAPYTFLSANAPINLNVLEVPGSSTTQGTQLDQYGENAGPNQQWNISAP
jgi:Ricin-type beta-trefoil lectin domain-like/Alginate lyase